MFKTETVNGNISGCVLLVLNDTIVYYSPYVIKAGLRGPDRGGVPGSSQVTYKYYFIISQFLNKIFITINLENYKISKF